MDLRIIDRNVVIGQCNIGPLTELFPEAKTAGGYIALPHTLEVSQVLNTAGYKCPSPIRTQYNWPGQYKPRWYQIDSAEAMTLNRRFFNLSACRTGKTNSTLWSADYLMGLGLVKSVLVVAPLSTLDDVWAQELFVSFHKRSFAVLHGSRAKRLDLLQRHHDFYIINPDGVKTIVEQLAEKKFDLLVLDELAEIASNTKTERFKCMKKLVHPETWVWGLTGTPTAQSPTQAYGQCKLVKPENYTGSFTSFRYATMQQITTFKWVPRPGAEQIVSKVLSPSIRFTRDVCTDMQPVHIFRKAELSEEQARHYKKLLSESVTEINNQTVTAVNAGVLLQKLVQTACGAVIDASGEVCDLDFGPRLQVLEELIEENEEKVLVLVPFTGALEAVKKALSKRWSCEIVNGDVSKSRRAEIFKAFRTGKDPHILVCHPQVMAHGLDLTAASLLIWYAPHPSNNFYLQANARIDGSKQTVKQDIAHIYATPVEQRIYKALQERGRLQDIVLELVKKGTNL